MKVQKHRKVQSDMFPTNLSTTNHCNFVSNLLLYKMCVNWMIVDFSPLTCCVLSVCKQAKQKKICPCTSKFESSMYSQQRYCFVICFHIQRSRLRGTERIWYKLLGLSKMYHHNHKAMNIFTSICKIFIQWFMNIYINIKARNNVM